MPQNTHTTVKLLTAAVLLVMTLSLLGVPIVSGVPDYPFTGNSTILSKPGFPVAIEEGQIPIGDVWTYQVPLVKGKQYHIYLIGDWVDLEQHVTDYDIFFYKKRYNREVFISSHTEAAGYPEQVSNDGLGHFFTPDESTKYYLCVRNDPNDSNATEPASLVIIEHLELNKFVYVDMEEPVLNVTVPKSSWAFEFNTSKPRIKIDIEVPSTLDMYEARLYPMANPNEAIGGYVDGLLTPWDGGLYGNLNEDYGGFNDDPQGYRHIDASDSCEMNGEDMLIDYTSDTSDQILYHLLYMAEIGEGSLRFRIQTDFTPPVVNLVNPPKYIISDEEAILRADIEDETSINQVLFHYSTDGNVTWRHLDPSFDNGVYVVTLPPKKGGTLVDYYWEAMDSLGNTGSNHSVCKSMTPTNLLIEVEPETVLGGNSVTATGFLGLPDMTLALNYTLGAHVAMFNVTTDENGAFEHVFTPNNVGHWNATCEYTGDETNWPSTSNTAQFNVNRKQTSLSLSISRDWIGLGDYVNVSGNFSEKRVGYEVYISARNGVNTSTLFALTDDDGIFMTTFKPDRMGEWSLRAEVAQDGVYTASAISPPKYLDVRDPTVVYRVTELKNVLSNPPYIYGVGAALVGSIGGGLFMAKRRGYLDRLLNRGETVEETLDEDLDDEEDEFDF